MAHVLKFDSYRTCVVDIRVTFPNGAVIMGVGTKSNYDKHYNDIQFYTTLDTEATGGVVPEAGTPEYAYATAMFEAQADYEAATLEARKARDEAVKNAKDALAATAPSKPSHAAPEDILQLVAR